jgi:cell division protein FtsB
MNKFRVSPRQVLLIIFIVIAVFLLLDYQSRKTLLYQVQTQNKLIKEEVVILRQTEIALEQDVDYANSPVMVDQFAREELGAGKEGDILVVPIAPYEITPTPTPAILPTPQSIENWRVWVAVFFDK